MKLRVILSLIVVLFIGQSMCAMSTQILRRPIVLDGELIDNGTRSINPLIPISADIDGTTLFIEFTKVIGNVDITVKDDTKKEVYSSSVDVTAANQATSFSIADLAPGTYQFEWWLCIWTIYCRINNFSLDEKHIIICGDGTYKQSGNQEDIAHLLERR